MMPPDGTPYRPSNGTVGMTVIARWCTGCAKSGPERAGCAIVARTMAFDEDDPRYPREWRYRDGRPVCTAREPSAAGGVG